MPLALLTGLALLSSTWAQDEGLALYFSLRLLWLFLLVVAIVRLRPRPGLVAWGMAITLLIQATIALLQFSRQSDLNGQFLGEVPLDILGLVSVIRVGTAQFIRGYGLTPHPNILGGVLVAFLLSLVAVFLAPHLSKAQKAGEVKQTRRVVWLIIMGMGAGGLLVSFSRSAWLGGVIGGVFFLVMVFITPTWRQAYGRFIAIPVALALILFTVFFALRPSLFLARLMPSASYTETRSLDERARLTQLAGQIITAQPFTGVGAGGFSQAIVADVQKWDNVRPQPVHSVPLLISSELGLVGGLLWLWLMVAPAWGAWRLWRAGRLTLWGVGLTAALLALAVTDWFDYYSWGWAQGRLLRWTLWGLWLNEVNNDATEI
jgi:O-antigen ligase